MESQQFLKMCYLTKSDSQPPETKSLESSFHEAGSLGFECPHLDPSLPSQGELQKEAGPGAETGEGDWKPVDPL